MVHILLVFLIRAFAYPLMRRVVFGCSYLLSNWSWRIPYIVRCLHSVRRSSRALIFNSQIHVPFAIMMSILVAFVPESPRWLSKYQSDLVGFLANVLLF